MTRATLTRQLEREDTRTDDELAARVLRGDAAAFSELSRRHSRLVAAAMRRASPGLSHDDLRQEALLGLLEACHDADRDRAAFAGVAERHVRARVDAACLAVARDAALPAHVRRRQALGLLWAVQP